MPVTSQKYLYSLLKLNDWLKVYIDSFRRESYIYTYIHKEIYYKELAHVITQADKSQDLQSVS